MSPEEVAAMKASATTIATDGNLSSDGSPPPASESGDTIPLNEDDRPAEL